MASYTVTASEIGTHGKTLVASTVDAVTFADDVPRVTIISDGAAATVVKLISAGAATYSVQREN